MEYNDLVNKYKLSEELAQEIADGTLYARILVHEAGHLVTSLEYGRYVTEITLPSKSVMDNNAGNYLNDLYKRVAADPKSVPPYKTSRQEYPVLSPIDLEEEIAICYAGKVAEEIVFGDSIRGSYLDIKRASKLIKVYLDEGFDNTWINVDEFSLTLREDAIKNLQTRCRLKCMNTINTYLGTMLKFINSKMYGVEYVQVQTDSIEFLVKLSSSKGVKSFNGLNSNAIS